MRNLRSEIMSASRIESDSMGQIEVSAEAYYGAQTERARRNFRVSGLTFQSRFVAALGALKAEAARVNVELGVLEEAKGRAIAEAAEEVAAPAEPSAPADAEAEAEKAIDEVREQAAAEVEGMSEEDMDAVVAEELERLQR